MGTKYISRKKNRRGNWVKYRDDRLVTAQQSTGAAQIANLKYILKNGSTGEFVEALDSIINERVRVALGQLVNNLDKGTGLAKVLGIDASNDLGASSIANLASVLSVNKVDPYDQVIVEQIFSNDSVVLPVHGRYNIVFYVDLSSGSFFTFGAIFIGFDSIGHWWGPRDLSLDFTKVSGGLQARNFSGETKSYSFKVLHLFD